MAEIEKKEPGRATVEQPERGDPRQHQQPVDKTEDADQIPTKANDQPPAPRTTEDPWMGGG